MKAKNGCNKVTIELRVGQFWSEIILAYDFRPKIALHSVQYIITIISHIRYKFASSQGNTLILLEFIIDIHCYALCSS